MTFAPFGKVDLDPVYHDLKILGLPEIHFLEKAKFMHKYKNGNLPMIFENFFDIHYSPPPFFYFCLPLFSLCIDWARRNPLFVGFYTKFNYCHQKQVLKGKWQNMPSLKHPT